MGDIGVIISWLIIGALSGSLVGRLLKGRKEGYGFIMNLVFGCAGALLGWGLFALIGVDVGTTIKITLNQVVYAMVGTALVILVWKVTQRKKKAA